MAILFFLAPPDPGKTPSSLAFVHKSGFVLDPFHERLSKEPGLVDLLSKPLPVVGRSGQPDSYNSPRRSRCE